MANKRPHSDLSPGAQYVAYGTALPPLDSAARDDGSYVPLWKQEVTDERGRKRLHGAFTGGFSAGYFNTVGSKEGWTPSAFKSSRTARATTKPAAPEDFMDEEDIREAEESKVLETNRDFTGIGNANNDAAPLEFLMPAVKSTRGYTLLRKMGWRDGAAIGPKMRLPPPPSGLLDGTTDSGRLTTSSPQIYIPKPKNDSRGLGILEGSSSQREKEPTWNSASKTAFVPTASATKGNRKPRGSAFGVGILNDDEDEDDVYEIRPKAAYNKSLDIERGKSRLKGRPGSKHVFVSKKSASDTVAIRKCHDDRIPLAGFRLASPLPAQSQHWPMPSVPDDWSPKNMITSSRAVDGLNGVVHNPASRAKLLGEAPLPGKSVFSYVTAESRNRLAALTGRVDLPPGLGEAGAISSAPVMKSNTSDLVPDLEPHVAVAALNHSSMPYSDDPDKRRRYRTFLEIKAGQRDGLPERKYGMHTQDWIKEMAEFFAAAQIFRPLAGSIANRFTSAVSTTEGNMSSIISSSADPVILHASDTAGEAADMGMYGPLTRTIVDFRPSHLLCKRFGISVPPLHPTSSSKSGGDWGRVEGMVSNPAPEPTTKPNIVESERANTDSLGVSVNRVQEEEEERAADEVFQAIFGDDD